MPNDYPSGYYYLPVIQGKGYVVALERKSPRVSMVVKYTEHAPSPKDTVFGMLDEQQEVWIFEAVNWDLKVRIFASDVREVVKVAFFLYWQWRKTHKSVTS